MCSSGLFLGLGMDDGQIYSRVGTNDDTPMGDSWTQLESFQNGFSQISCGYRDMMVAVAEGVAYFRTGYTETTLQGTGWEAFSTNGIESDDMTFTHISVGDDGKIWAIADGDVYAREGDFPRGSSWKLINGGRMRQVEVGRESVWGLNKWNEIWYREQCPDEDEDCDLTQTDWTNEPGTLIWIACA